MTRETKIGLLVGLAFIIVIGILLSDHLSSTSEPPPAQLAQAGASVRLGVNAPGVSNAGAPVFIAPQQPQFVGQPVPTQEELTAKPKPSPLIGIGPASTNGKIEIPVQQPVPNQSDPPVTFVQPDALDHSNTQNNSGQPIDPLTEIANRTGEPIIGLNGATDTNRSGLANNNGAQPAAPLPNGFKEYKAGEGDTVSRMASKFLGANTPANRDLIVKANPSLTKNPDIVVSGRTYRIPITQPAQTAVTSATNSTEPTKAEIAKAPIVSVTTESTYTVKSGDSLWKIANTELGNPGAVEAIKDLNSDTLKGGETVTIGMKLKLPAKPIASAQ